ncbi:hypothetical protein GCM10009678_53080 [Actinomadura kijaniata]|uniref:Uncharacterized protein n=1 Tax=Actinomadura namibiensis TaxID=182080 RepID=A0A7W3LS09_ACTNM|nr:hypothetical protein [Actinomadura namibiensis]MBA8953130.1 hypothetical protein [Actinomadura namibiensis]
MSVDRHRGDIIGRLTLFLSHLARAVAEQRDAEAGPTHPAVVEAMRLLEARPAHRWSLAEPEWIDVLGDADRRGLTPLFHTNMTPYGDIQLNLDRRLTLTAAPAPAESQTEAQTDSAAT